MKAHTFYTLFAAVVAFAKAFETDIEYPSSDPIVQYNKQLDNKLEKSSYEQMLDEDETMFGSLFELPDNLLDETDISDEINTN